MNMINRQSLCLGLWLLPFLVPAAVIVYPEYPEAIPRDYAYRIQVTQGETRRPVVVYNRTEKSQLIGRTRGGDVNRRFCEFAFDGGPVTVEIRVTEDVKSYAVFPSRLGLRHAFRDGVISVTLERPCNFGIRLNDYDKTILSVFADAPERAEEIPSKGAPGVMYVEGWLDAPGRDGALETKDDVKEIYLAPGAVLNARLIVRGRGTFVHGRGMILDPLSDIFRFDQTKNTRRGLLTVGAPGVRVKDVKLVDARTFNFMSWHPEVRVENIRELSAMMCTDGFTIGGKGFSCDGAWLYVGDNALVLGGGSDFAISNVVIGTSCAAIFPQGSPRGRLVNVDVFRTDDGFLNNVYNGVLRRNNKWNEMNGGVQKREPGPQDLVHQTCDLVFDSVSLVDCTRLTHLFRGRNMGTKLKRYVFNGLAAPMPEEKVVCIDLDLKKWLDTDNYDITFNGLRLDGKSVTALDDSMLVHPERMKLAVNAGAAPVLREADRVETNWTCPHKVFCGAALVRDWRQIAPDGQARQLPALRPDTNLVREIWPRQSVWQRVPSWLVKMETENGTDPTNRVYKLVQCERGAGMQAVVTDEALALGKGTYRLAFEARAELSDGKFPVALKTLVRSNDWKVEATASAGSEWTPCAVEFALPIDVSRDDLVGVSILATRPVDVLRVRRVSLTKVAL